MNCHKESLIIAVIVFVLVSWLGRYELVGVPAGGEGVHGAAYRLDRWTGQVVYNRFGEAGVSEMKLKPKVEQSSLKVQEFVRDVLADADKYEAEERARAAARLQKLGFGDLLADADKEEREAEERIRAENITTKVREAAERTRK